MPEKKRFLLRVEEDVYAGLERWAADELRSVNAQIEFLLADALKRAGRAKLSSGAAGVTSEPAGGPDAPPGPANPEPP